MSIFPKADVPTTAAALAALLVAADGVIDDREKAVAIRLGQGMFIDFSPWVFERLLEGIGELPSPRQLAESVRPLLDEDAATVIMEYLVALAVADERVVEIERQQLEDVALGLGVAMPSFGPYEVENG